MHRGRSDRLQHGDSLCKEAHDWPCSDIGRAVAADRQNEAKGGNDGTAGYLLMGS
jgi:hypothetical protein